LMSKKISKTRSVTSQLDYEIGDDNVHIGPSDYVPWLQDRKWAYIRLEGRSFGDVPLNVELKLEVHDSPNSAGVVIDAVRCCKLALDRGVSGTLEGPSSYFMKSPPVQHSDPDARRLTGRDHGRPPHGIVGRGRVPGGGSRLPDLRRRRRVPRLARGRGRDNAPALRPEGDPARTLGRASAAGSVEGELGGGAALRPAPRAGDRGRVLRAAGGGPRRPRLAGAQDRRPADPGLPVADGPRPLPRAHGLPARPRRRRRSRCDAAG